MAKLELLDSMPDLKEVTQLFFPPCIYFLIRNDEIIYVGKSVSLPARLQNHKENGKYFDKCLYMEVDHTYMDKMEILFIKALEPRLNSSGRGKSLWCDIHNSYHTSPCVEMYNGRKIKLKCTKCGRLLPVKKNGRVWKHDPLKRANPLDYSACSGDEEIHPDFRAPETQAEIINRKARYQGNLLEVLSLLKTHNLNHFQITLMMDWAVDDEPYPGSMLDHYNEVKKNWEKHGDDKNRD